MVNLVKAHSGGMVGGCPIRKCKWLCDQCSTYDHITMILARYHCASPRLGIWNVSVLLWGWILPIAKFIISFENFHNDSIPSALSIPLSTPQSPWTTPPTVTVPIILSLHSIPFSSLSWLSIDTIVKPLPPSTSPSLPREHKPKIGLVYYLHLLYLYHLNCRHYDIITPWWTIRIFIFLRLSCIQHFHHSRTCPRSAQLYEPSQLANRLKRQNLKGADIGHLSPSTVSHILSEATGLRAQFRSVLEEDKVPVVLACTRKDMRLLLKFITDVFCRDGSDANNVILNPSTANRVKELSLRLSRPSRLEVYLHSRKLRRLSYPLVPDHGHPCQISLWIFSSPAFAFRPIYSVVRLGSRSFIWNIFLASQWISVVIGSNE